MTRRTDGADATPQLAETLARHPASLGAAEIASAARSPLTMLGSLLRETNETSALTASQSLVLSQLTAADSLPITELAAADGRAVSTMTEIVRRLVNAGFVVKHNGIEDRRQVRVSITDAGRSALEGNLRLRDEALAQRIGELAEHERVALASALPALWKLAGIDPQLWPQMRPRPGRPRRRRTTKLDPGSA